MNSDANSSSTTSSTTSTNGGGQSLLKNSVNSTTGNGNKTHRQVNFKLEIKAEPDPLGLHILPEQPRGVQKVPSISDLSDAESSLDIPCNQVS